MAAERGAKQSTDGEAAGPRSRWSQIASDLAAAIEAGHHATGDLLPSAEQIAEGYGVHRHTVRQALRHLQDLGLVSVERGRGTIVTGRRFPYRIGRRVSLRSNLGAEGLSVEGEIVSSGKARANEAAIAALTIEPTAEVWEIRTVNRAAGVPVSTGLHRLCAARFPDFPERLKSARASITAAFATYGIREYVRLSTRLTARSATREESTLLGLPRGGAVLRSVAIDGLPDGAPLQLVDAAFAGDNVEFVIDLELDDSA